MDSSGLLRDVKTFLMFRKPREAAAPIASENPRPINRTPPTPPFSSSQRPQAAAANTIYSMTTSMSSMNRNNTTSKRNTAPMAGKGKGKDNGNILSFFKKVQSSGTRAVNIKEEDGEEGLFLEESPVKMGATMPLQTPTPPRDWTTPEDVEMETTDSPLSHYNEDPVPNKRRRTEGSGSSTPEMAKEPVQTRQRGPFVDDSDSDDEPLTVTPANQLRKVASGEASVHNTSDTATPPESKPQDKIPTTTPVPPLIREPTSLGDVDGFDGMDDFIDDEFPEEGEEFIERRWMEEQAELEMGLEEDEGLGDAETTSRQDISEHLIGSVPKDAGPTPCPICGGSTVGMTEQVSQIQSSCGAY